MTAPSHQDLESRRLVRLGKERVESVSSFCAPPSTLSHLSPFPSRRTRYRELSFRDTTLERTIAGIFKSLFRPFVSPSIRLVPRQLSLTSLEWTQASRMHYAELLYLRYDPCYLSFLLGGEFAPAVSTGTRLTFHFIRHRSQRSPSKPSTFGTIRP